MNAASPARTIPPEHVPPLESRNLVTEEQIRRAIELRQRGLYDAEIGQQLGVPRSRVQTIFDAARRNGIAVPVSPYQQRCATRPKYQEEDRGYDTPCWIWLLAKDDNGYGWWHKNGEGLAHRAFYKAAYGPIPEGLTLHHRCEQPSCVNPDHLEPMSRREHMATHDLWARRKVVQDIEVIRRVREAAALGGTFEGLARVHGVSPQTIMRIVRREGGYACFD